MKNYEMVNGDFPFIMGSTIADYPVDYTKVPAVDIFNPYQYQVGILPVELMKFFFLIIGLCRFFYQRIEPTFFLKDRGFLSFCGVSQKQQEQYINVLTEMFWKDIEKEFPPPKKFSGIRKSRIVVTWDGEPNDLSDDLKPLRGILYHNYRAGQQQ